MKQLSVQEKEFSSLYRVMAKNFGLSESSVWVCYFLLVNSGDITQQDLVEQMMFPKQTIHSSVKKLSADQYVRVTPLPSSLKSKKLSLTEKGKTYIEMTVAKMVEAEKEAIRAMGQEDMQKYVELQGKYLTLVKNEFTKAELLTLTDDMENN
ncbi:MAG: MarR family transcriptional regulator [Streptococcus sp.]|uniref:MarR family transcriptional regulator n=1 Tax=Streptococcus sp. TaxID=1306 RepID=UPI0028FF6107|nr:MarR family transcriptional regulator [Streptococcus sp.]MDU2588988.1 MarR family transcriptional regulator [Streptococcus sp.]